MAQRVVITGAGGLVGRVLAAEAGRRGHEVLALASAQCDVTDPAALARHITGGDVVVNCAAYTRVDDAESDEARATAVNGTGAANVAHACVSAGADLVHVSTDYVFSGDFGDDPQRPYEIDDLTDPLSAYGRSKLAGELGVLTAMPDAFVVRTAWIFSGTGSDFVANMRRKAAGGDTVDVVADQIGSPTYVGDLVGALLQVVEGTIAQPVLHAANLGEASRFEQARAVFELAGADPERVRPIDSERFPRPAPRPAYSALGAQQSTEAGLTPLRHWREGLAEAMSAPLSE
jgi:dTDP-4-dehydrorhamnose reductase